MAVLVLCAGTGSLVLCGFVARCVVEINGLLFLKKILAMRATKNKPTENDCEPKSNILQYKEGVAAF